MIKDIKELNFPAYATLETATATIADMGDRTISAQVKIDGNVVPDFSYDWEVEFKGERYIHPVKTPQGTKDNSSLRAKIDLVFQHWAIYEMKRQYFVEMASTTAGTAIADKYIASLGLNLGDFVTAFNLVLNHYFDGRIVIRLNPEWQYDAEAKFVSISYSYIWDVLQQMHEIYGVRWTLKTNADGVCEILMGYPADEVSHIFEYGFEGGLLSVQRQVQSTEIRNRLLGRGGSKNLPARYFKDKDPNNPLFEADPDWIPELANIVFTELRGKTFRDYVRGWKAKRYGGTPMAEPTEAYLAGYNAEKFDPIEYVEDKDSIAKYGVLIGALENNEEIYPSIQGAPGEVDVVVDAEQVTDDDVNSAVENDAVTTNLESGYQSERIAANSTATIQTQIKRYFSVPAGKTGSLDMSITVTGKYSDRGKYEKTYPIIKSDSVRIDIHDVNTDEVIVSSSAPVINIPSGDFYYIVSADVESNYDKETRVTLDIESVKLYVSTPNSPSGWKSTFDIWVRNIWGSSRNSGETDQQYADRVWGPILGDRTGGEARVVFASGWLSFSPDWEFPIVGYAFDDSKDGSEWRLTLAKSEAELEASGKYIPYEGYNASAGDKFFFIGIDMTHQYVLWGEERVDDYKRDSLSQTAEINPAWVVKTDKVRLNQDRNGERLINELSAGSQIRLASNQFISGAYENLYVQSVTYNWQADTIMYPDVEVVLSDKVTAVKNPVTQIQSSIETLQRQVGSLSNIQQIIRQVCDRLYLRKDGVEDLSKSPTRFLGRVTGDKFRQGKIGGRDWGIYKDETGKSVAEFDKLVIRELLSVAELEVNHVTHMGGTRVMSGAEMECIAVEENADAYICYFDQKQGSKINLFAVDDIVWSQDFDSDNTTLKYYKSVVTSIGDNYIQISKNQYDGAGVPAVGDVIIQAGNISDTNRQSIIIIDATGNPSISLYRGVDSFILPDPETRIQSGNNILTGKVHFQPGSTGVENLDINFGGQNMLRNSGFTGDYLSEELTDETVLEAASQMYSAPLDHWDGTANVSVVEEEDSASGYAARMPYNGILVQPLYQKTIAEENYVLSFRSKGEATVTAIIGGVTSTIEIDSADAYKRYVVSFVATEGTHQFVLRTNAEILLCEPQLERGTVATAWGYSWLDNNSDRAYWQSMKYLQQAIAGSSTVAGGLILTNLIQLGSQSNNSEFVEKAGVSGLYANDDSLAFWAGGTMAQAIALVKAYSENAGAELSDAQAAALAKFAVTHGGRAILNDMIVRGYIYALGGKIGGLEIKDGGIYTKTNTGGEVLFTPVGLIARQADGSFTELGTCGSHAIMVNGKDAGGQCYLNEDLYKIAAQINAANGYHAIHSLSGMYAGLRPKIRAVTASETLTELDHTLVVSNAEAITLTLPSYPQTGQTYKLIHTNGNVVMFSHPDTHIIIDATAANGVITSFNRQTTLVLTYLDGVWYAEFNN